MTSGGSKAKVRTEALSDHPESRSSTLRRRQSSNELHNDAELKLMRRTNSRESR